MAGDVRILVVDRPNGPLTFYSSVLRRRDQQLAWAHSGEGALNVLASQHPRLVIFTFDLTDMEAPEFCRQIRDREETRGISALFIAERSSEEHVDLCMAAGCNDILLQPFEAEELDEKVQKLTSVPVRRDLRTLTKVEVSIPANSYYQLGHSVNLSSTGMLLEMNHVLPAEAKIRVHFYLRGEREPLKLGAEVVRAEFSGTSPRYGIHFIAIQPQEKDRIDRFVRRLRAREAN